MSQQPPATPSDHFVDMLSELRNGAALQEYGEGLRDLLREVEETGKAGAIAITIKVSPADAKTKGHVVIEDDVKVRLPQPARSKTFLFTTKDGGLSRRDPRQMDIEDLTKPKRDGEPPLRVVTGKETTSE